MDFSNSDQFPPVYLSQALHPKSDASLYITSIAGTIGFT